MEVVVITHKGGQRSDGNVSDWLVSGRVSMVHSCCWQLTVMPARHGDYSRVDVPCVLLLLLDEQSLLRFFTVSLLLTVRGLFCRPALQKCAVWLHLTSPF